MGIPRLVISFERHPSSFQPEIFSCTLSIVPLLSRSLFNTSVITASVSSLRQHGSHQANRSQSHWRQSSPKTARDQGGSQECPCYRRFQEASSLSSWHCCTPRNPSLPKKHRTSYPQVAIPVLSEETYTGGQGRRVFSIYIIVSSTRDL